MKNTKWVCVLFTVVGVICGVGLLSCNMFKSHGDKKMKVTVEVPIANILRTLAANSTDSVFYKSMALAEVSATTANDDFLLLFEKAWNRLAPNAHLYSVFMLNLDQKVKFNSTNAEVLQVLSQQIDQTIDQTIANIENRLNQMDAKIVSLQKLNKRGRFVVELEDVAFPEQVLKTISMNARLEFWETYDNKDIYSLMEQANKKAKAISDKETQTQTNITQNKPQADTTEFGLAKNTTVEQFAIDNPLFAYLQPAITQDKKGNYYLNQGPVVGFCKMADTAKVNQLLHQAQIALVFPPQLRFAWSAKPLNTNNELLQLLALKATRDGKPTLEGAPYITDSRVEYNDQKQIEIMMSMNAEGAAKWRKITANNIGKSVAILLDDYVYCYPTVQGEIPNGNSSISGNFTEAEAKNLARVIKAGRLPSQTNIVDVVIMDKNGTIIKQ